MSARFAPCALVLVASMVLVGCGEPLQQAGASTAAKRDASPHSGTESSRFASEGFKPGDKQAWAAHLVARAQYTQNDHQRTGK